jgi:hypothetical protein
MPHLAPIQVCSQITLLPKESIDERFSRRPNYIIAIDGSAFNFALRARATCKLYRDGYQFD